MGRRRQMAPVFRFCRATAVWTAFIILLSAGGCADDTREPATLALTNPELIREGNELVARVGMDVTLGPEAMEALDNGVALTLNVQTRTTTGRLPMFRRKITRNHRLEIRYLPLSRHYQLTQSRHDIQRSFPRLWMLLAALEEPMDFDTRLTMNDVAHDQWRLQIRAVLDISRLPPPMRLPAWFSREWRLASDWHTWSVDSNAQTATRNPELRPQ